MHVRGVMACLMLVILCTTVCALDHTGVNVQTTEESAKFGMLGLWHMNDQGSTESDSTVNGNDGVVLGAESVSGWFTRARAFDGDDFIGITNKNFSVCHNISFSMFVKLDSYSSGRSSLWSATDDGNISMWLGLNMTKLQFEVRDSNGNIHIIKSSSSITLKKWTPIAAIFNGYDNYMGIFTNGNQSVGGIIPKVGNQTHYHIHTLAYSTLVLGATFTNDTVNYFTGSMDEVIVYDGDLVYLQELYAKPPPPPTVSRDTSRYVVVGLAVLGICLFVILVIMSRQMGFSLRAPSTGILLSLLIGILAGTSIAFAYSPLCARWGLILLIIGFTMLVMFVLIRFNQVDLMGNKIEQALPLATPILAAILLAVGAVDGATGCLSSLGHPFWLA